MKPLHLLIKPASSLCNLRCRYCFYHDVSEHRLTSSYGLMPSERMQALVRQAFAEANGPVTFAFQGGEPTLCGLSFYEDLIGWVQTYNEKKLPVQYAMQTNGQSIDADWARFLARHRFLVGLSLDGDKAIHDRLRQDDKGRGSFGRVMQTAALFRQHQVDFNILTVVHRDVARHAQRIYQFYKRQDFRYLQFIPCLSPLGVDPETLPFSLRAQDYAQFLKTVFDLWYDDLMAGQYTSIRHFDNWVRMLAGQPPELCGLVGRCTCQLVVEADGSVYPCDFYVTDDWRLGFIGQKSFADMAQNEAAQTFIEQSLKKDPRCDDCAYEPICRGGCRRDRDTASPLDGLDLNRFCPAYREFFPYALERMQKLATAYQQQSHASRRT